MCSVCSVRWFRSADSFKLRRFRGMYSRRLSGPCGAGRFGARRDTLAGKTSVSGLPLFCMFLNWQFKSLIERDDDSDECMCAKMDAAASGAAP